MFYVRLGERQENTTERTPSKPLYIYIYKAKEFARGSSRNVLLAFSQSYVEHDLRKSKIVIPFFC
jgi:hypothetical protein